MREVQVIVTEDVSGLLPLDATIIQSYVAETMGSHGAAGFDVNIVFIGDQEMTELNENYKKRRGTTNVLSFNLSEDANESVEGEVYVSLEQARKQASEYGVSYEEEIIRLVTHGVLHLIDWTHENDEAQRSMENETEKLVHTFFGMRK